MFTLGQQAMLYHPICHAGQFDDLRPTILKRCGAHWRYIGRN